MLKNIRYNRIAAIIYAVLVCLLTIQSANALPPNNPIGRLLKDTTKFIDFESDPGSQISSIGDHIQLKLTAIDPQQGAISYSATGLPAGLAIDSQSGLISGILTEASTGSYVASVQAVSDRGINQQTGYATLVFEWDIKSANGILIDGIGTDWAQLPGYLDSDMTSPSASVPDLKTIWFDQDISRLYLAFSFELSGRWSYRTVVNVYIDSDRQSSTGYQIGGIGADFLIDNFSQDALLGRGALLSYKGNGSDWKWSNFDEPARKGVKIQTNHTSFAEYEIPKAILDNSNQYDILFYTSLSTHPPDNPVINDSFLLSTSAPPDTNFPSKGLQLPVNFPPKVTNPGDQVSHAGEQIDLAIVVDDQDSNLLTFSATGLPAGLSINSATGVTGVISGIIASDADSHYQVLVSVNDGQSTRHAAFVWNILVAEKKVIDGNDSDWLEQKAFKDNKVNNTVFADYQSVWYDQDDNNLYIAYRNKEPIDPAKLWAWTVFIDSDTQISTGYKTGQGFKTGGGVGAEYLLQGNQLYRFTGQDIFDWQWQSIGRVDYAVNGDFAEFSISKQLLGQRSRFNLYFTATEERFPRDQLLVTTQTLFIDGNSADWSVIPYQADYSTGTSPVDISKAWVNQDNHNLYLAYENRADITFGNLTAFQIYIDSDSEFSTGYRILDYVGADYLLEGNVLWEYTGTGSDWQWKKVNSRYMSGVDRNLEFVWQGNFAEAMIPRSSLGQNQSQRFNVIFSGANTWLNGTENDWIVFLQ